MRDQKMTKRPTTFPAAELARFWELAGDLAAYPTAVKLAAFDALVTDFHTALGDEAFMKFQVIIGRAAGAVGR